MSSLQESLNLKSVVSNSEGLSQVKGLHEDNLKRNGHLRIIRKSTDEGDQFWMYCAGDDIFPAGESWEADIPLDPNTLFGHVEECRKAWTNEVVLGFQEMVQNPEGGSRPSFPFQESWDLKDRPELLASALPKLAVAGARLFSLIFECDGGPGLKRIADRLKGACQRGVELTLLITSDAFFAPWNLIYVHPIAGEELASDGSNVKKEGFWGYAHIVEHNTSQIDLPTEIRPNAKGKIYTSINIDDRIDASLKVKCIEPQLEYFLKHAGLEPVIRKTKLELQDALTTDVVADQILYFCCHGAGASVDGQASIAQSRLALADDKQITSADIKVWRNGRGFSSNPLVFINACQGGQMTTLFYKSIAAEFLKQKALAVIGAQIDIPALFAAEFARTLFGRFLAKGSANRIRLGPLIRELSRHYLDEFNNPLSFAYSLYRGADCFVEDRSRWQ